MVVDEVKAVIGWAITQNNVGRERERERERSLTTNNTSQWCRSHTSTKNDPPKLVKGTKQNINLVNGELLRACFFGSECEKKHL